jgi:hypothetical protein
MLVVHVLQRGATEGGSGSELIQRFCPKYEALKHKEMQESDCCRHSSWIG